LPTRKRSLQRRPRPPLMLAVLVLFVISAGALVAYWILTGLGSKERESSWNTERAALPGEVVVIGAYVLCYSYEERNGSLLALGDCELVIDVLNNSTHELLVYGVVLPDAGVSVLVNKTIQPGKAERLVGRFSLATATPVERLLRGYLVTSAGRVRVEFSIPA